MTDTVQLRSLNDEGKRLFEDFLTRGKVDKVDAPFWLLGHDDYTSVYSDIQVNVTPNSSRYELGEYLTDILSSIDETKLVTEDGVWNWLSLLWIDGLAPTQSSGLRKLAKPYNYIVSKNWNHRYRHALLMSWRLVKDYSIESRFMLSGKDLATRGEIIEQILGRSQHYISCNGVIKAASKLYYDEEKLTFKRGSTSRNKKGAVSRYLDFLQQLEMTYDLGSISTEALLGLLPREFDKFKNI